MIQSHIQIFLSAYASVQCARLWVLVLGFLPTAASNEDEGRDAILGNAGVEMDLLGVRALAALIFLTSQHPALLSLSVSCQQHVLAVPEHDWQS